MISKTLEKKMATRRKECIIPAWYSKTTLPSKPWSHRSFYPTPLENTRSSVSERPNVPSLNVSSTPLCSTAVTVVKNLRLVWLFNKLSNLSTSRPTRTHLVSSSRQWKPEVPERTLKELEKVVPSKDKLSMFPPWGELAKLSTSCVLEPENLLWGLLKVWLNALPMKLSLVLKMMREVILFRKKLNVKRMPRLIDDCSPVNMIFLHSIPEINLF